MPRPKTGDKRAAILRAAAETIAEDGVGASTASIAKAAAVAEGPLFRYFPDKDNLLNERFLDPVNIAILKTCPMDDGGYFNFGPTNMWQRAVVERAKRTLISARIWNGRPTKTD
jgi:acyl-CoA hydrolase